MTDKDTLIYLLGPAGAGKGTVGRALDGRLYSAGELIRAEIARDTARGRNVKELMDSGQDVPIEVSYELLREALAKHPRREPTILDGYPRKPDQIDLLASITGREPERVVVLHAPTEILVDRILNRLWCERCFATYGPGNPASNDRCPDCEVPLGQREEDKDISAIQTRHVSWTHNSTAILEHYRRTTRVHSIAADAPLATVLQRTRAALQRS